MRIALIRHPQTQAGAEGRFPNGGEEYSPEGCRQFANLLTQRPDGALYTSDLPRCRNLAEALSVRYGVPLQLDPALREIDLGVFGGKTFDQIAGAFTGEVEAWMQDPESFAYPEGESFPDFRLRVRCFLSRLPDSACVLVTHQGVIHVILKELLGEEAAAAPVRCGEKVVLLLKDGKWARHPGE